MKIEFKGMLSPLEYDGLKAELNYLKENHNVNFTLNKECVVFSCVDEDIEEMLKDSIYSVYDTKQV